MTAFIIIASLALPAGFVLGWCVGHSVGKADGYAEYEDWCRRGGRFAR